MQKIFIADPALRDHRGHHFNLTKMYSQVCASAGLRPIWLVNKAYELPPDDGITMVRCFSEDSYSAFANARSPVSENDQKSSARVSRGEAVSPIKRLYRLLPLRYRQRLTPVVHKFLKRARRSKTDALDDATRESSPTQVPRPEVELLTALQKFQFNSDDVVFFHTAHADTYRLVTDFYSAAVPVRNWNAFPLFRLSTPYDERVMPHNQSKPDMRVYVDRLSRLGLLDRRVFLHAENEALAEHLSTAMNQRVTPIAIPPIDQPCDLTQIEPNQNLQIAYLGPARTEKGFPLLPDMVQSILAYEPRLAVKITIQITPQILGYTQDVLDAVRLLQAIQDDRLVLIVDPLEYDAYATLLRQTDVVLMPYDRERYSVRSSGIAVEAVLSEAVVMSFANTFPAHLAGSAGVTLDTHTPVAELIEHIASNREHFRKLCRDRREWYLEHHSQQKCADAVSSAGGMIDESEPPSPPGGEWPEWIPLITRESD